MQPHMSAAEIAQVELQLAGRASLLEFGCGGSTLVAARQVQRIVGVDSDPAWLACDTVVLCAGQTPLRALADALQAAGRTVHVVGGALEAGELDAKRAIDQAARLAARL